MKNWLVINIKCKKCGKRLRINTGAYEKLLCKTCNEYCTREEII